MEKYLIERSFCWRGRYEEPLYDDNPSLGTYTQTVYPLFRKDDIFCVDEGVIMVPDDEFMYGVSMHPGTLRLNPIGQDALKELIRNGSIAPIVDEKLIGKYEELCLKYRELSDELSEKLVVMDYFDEIFTGEDPERDRMWVRLLFRIRELESDIRGLYLDRNYCRKKMTRISDVRGSL